MWNQHVQVFRHTSCPICRSWIEANRQQGQKCWLKFQTSLYAPRTGIKKMTCQHTVVYMADVAIKIALGPLFTLIIWSNWSYAWFKVFAAQNVCGSGGCMPCRCHNIKTKSEKWWHKSRVPSWKPKNARFESLGKIQKIQISKNTGWIKKLKANWGDLSSDFEKGFMKFVESDMDVHPTQSKGRPQKAAQTRRHLQDQRRKLRSWHPRFWQQKYKIQYQRLKCDLPQSRPCGWSCGKKIQMECKSWNIDCHKKLTKNCFIYSMLWKEKKKPDNNWKNALPNWNKHTSRHGTCRRAPTSKTLTSPCCDQKFHWPRRCRGGNACEGNDVGRHRFQGSGGRWKHV